MLRDRQESTSETGASRPKGGSTISVRELARRVGVSTATVSRALNNHPEVSPETRARVLALADREGYHFRVGKRFTSVIGLAYPNDPLHPAEASFESAMLSGVLAGANDERFDVQVINVERDKGSDESYTHFFRRKGVRGVIVRSLRQSPGLAEEIADEGFPCVLIADRSEHPNVSYVQGESRSTSIEAIEHLIGLGHRRIAISTNVQMDTDHRDRQEGYLEALRKHGLESDPGLIVRMSDTMRGGAEAVDSLLALENPPTAIYFTTPPGTLGALQRCLDLGLSVPDDLSIIGFDDCETRQRSFPRYTAVCQDATEFARRATLWLTKRLMDDSTPPLRVSLPTVFEVSDSTGPARVR